MNSRRPSKPNLPNVLKPSKLLLQWGCAEPISSLTYWIPLLDYSICQYEIGPFLTTSQAPNGLPIDVGMVRKGFGNEPLKDVTMERMRVEEFEKSLWWLVAVSHPRDPVASPCFFAQSWAFLHTLSLTTLTWIPPKYRVTNC